MVENSNPVAHAHCFFLIMSDKDKGDASFTLDSLELNLHLLAKLLI
jgi:hypothetical protein